MEKLTHIRLIGIVFLFIGMYRVVTGDTFVQMSPYMIITLLCEIIYKLDKILDKKR